MINTQSIYCGPNILKFGLLSYQVFIDELPYNVKEAINNIPELEYLFCSVENLDETRRLIREKGSALNVYYTEAEKKVREISGADKVK